MCALNYRLDSPIPRNSNVQNGTVVEILEPMYEIPWFSLRCRSVRVFATHEEVQDYLRPFAQEQDRLRQSSPLGSLV